MTSSTATCPRCGNAASGNFCASCGAALAVRTCTGCGAGLATGAQFCHRCGRAAAPGGTGGTAAREPARSTTPWIVATVLVVVSVGSIVYAAMRRDSPTAPDMANAGNAGTAAEGGGSVAAPDISKMTPREQFDRLYDRVMTSAQGSDTATVIRFWPMASGAYERLPDSSRDNDARFHMADLHLLVGQFPAATALADTILASSSDNLLGYYVRALVSEFQGDSAGARGARAAFTARYAAQISQSRPEYTHHRVMLDQYRQSLGGK